MRLHLRPLFPVKLVFLGLLSVLLAMGVIIADAAKPPEENIESLSIEQKSQANPSQAPAPDETGQAVWGPRGRPVRPPEMSEKGPDFKGLTIDLYYSLSLTGGNFSPSWRRLSAKGDYASMIIPLKFTYAVHKDLSVFLQLQFLQNRCSSVIPASPTGSRSAEFGGLGDLTAGCRYTLLEETESRPTLGLSFSVDFPTGHWEHRNPEKLGMDVLGSGVYFFGLGLDAAKWWYPFCLFGSLEYRIATNSSQPTGDTFALSSPELLFLHNRDQLGINLGTQYALTQSLLPFLQMYGRYDLGRLVGPKAIRSPGAVMGISPGLNYTFNDSISFNVSMAIDLVGKNYPFRYTPTIGFTYKY
jgi:hypothetical protein